MSLPLRGTQRVSPCYRETSLEIAHLLERLVVPRACSGYLEVFFLLDGTFPACFRASFTPGPRGAPVNISFSQGAAVAVQSTYRTDWDERFGENVIA